MSRSLTLPSSINKKLEPVRIQPSPTSNHLPDLVVNTSTLIQPTKINEIIHESTPSDTDNHVRFIFLIVSSSIKDFIIISRK